MVWRSVRLGIEAFNRRDFEALLVNYHPEVEFRPPRGWTESGMSDSSYRGHDGFPRFLRDLSAVWGTYRQEPRELIDLGDRLVVLGELRGRAEASGVPLAQPHASLFHLADGKLIRQQEYLDPAEALEAVGLKEPTSRADHPPFDAAL